MNWYQGLIIGIISALGIALILWRMFQKSHARKIQAGVGDKQKSKNATSLKYVSMKNHVKRFGNHLKSTEHRICWLIGWSLLPIAAIVYILHEKGKIFGIDIKDVQNILVMVLGAIPACVLWYYRDKAKQKDQEHIERDLAMKEKNDLWDNLTKFIKMAEGRGDETNNEKATAIYALGEYYAYENIQMRKQIHQFFRNYLEWHFVGCIYNWQNMSVEDIAIQLTRRAMDDLKSDARVTQIKAVYDILRRFSSKDNEKRISFAGDFSLALFYIPCIDFSGADLRDADLQGADFRGADFRDADLRGANLIKADLREVKLEGAKLMGACLMGAKLGAAVRDSDPQDAKFWDVDLWYATCYLMGAKYDSKTAFPEGFDPKSRGMISVDDSESAEKNVR
jgi:hypothetical protein